MYEWRMRNTYLMTFGSSLLGHIGYKPHILKLSKSVHSNHVSDNSIGYFPKEGPDPLHNTNLFV
jgi:hypothetical protein